MFKNIFYTLIFNLVLIICSSCTLAAENKQEGDLQSSIPEVRKHAVFSLGLEGNKSAVPALVKALKDPDPDVRSEAGKALGAIKDPRAVPGLLNALCDKEMNVRLYAAYALGEIKDPRGADRLLKALHDPEWCVRDQAAWALRELHEPSIAGQLLNALKEKETDVKQVLWILRGLADKPAQKSLSKLAQNPINDLTLTACLKMIKDPDVLLRKRAVLILDAIDDKQAVLPLIAALKDKIPAIRLDAATALQKIGDKRAVKPLQDSVSVEKDPVIRKTLLNALVQLSRNKYLAAFWNFDDSNSLTAKDVTNNTSNGQINGCKPVKGKIGAALEFGEGTFVSLGKPSAIPIAGHPFSITAWVKSDAPSGVVIARGGAWCGFCLYLKDGVAKFGIHRKRDGPSYIAGGSENVTGKWVHLAGVVRKNRIEIYVNGKLAGSAKTAGFIPQNCGQGMEIGCDQGTTSAEITNYFHGIIDEVRAYKTALSKKEIDKQYNKEK